MPPSLQSVFTQVSLVDIMGTLHRIIVMFIVGMAGGAMAIIDVDRWIIKNYVDVGVGTGPGHACFSEKHDMAIITTHATDFVRVIDGINGDRPDMRFYQRYRLGFNSEGLTDTLQSHSCYIDENEDFYYNFFTDGGVFFKIDLNTMRVVDSVYTGGIPIQGSYISLDDIYSNTIDALPAPVCDTGVDPQTIKQGEGTALWWWMSDEVTSASINNGIGSLSPASSSNYNWIYPAETTVYTMTANGAGGTSTTCETIIIVERQAEQNSPVCEMGVDPQIINTGEGTALWWWSDNVISANIDNNIGLVATPSDYTWFYPTQTTTYTMSGVNASGVTTSCNATITVQ